MRELQLWELVYAFSQSSADIPWLYVPNKSAHVISPSETVWVALLTALATQNPLVAWELHSICSRVQGEVLKWGYCGDLVTLIRKETGDGMLRRVVRAYNTWKLEGRPPYVSFCLAKSLNFAGLLDAQDSDGRVNWLGRAMKFWFTLTAGNGRGRWFGPRKGKTANQTAGSTRKKLQDLLEQLARERETDGGCEKGTVDTVDLTGWDSDEGDDADGAVAGTSMYAVEGVAKQPVKGPRVCQG